MRALCLMLLLAMPARALAREWRGPPLHTDSYNEEVMAADLVLDLCIVTGLATGADQLWLMCGIGYMAVGPAIHLLHGDGYRAVQSFSGRILFPVLTLYVASRFGTDPGSGELSQDTRFTTGAWAALGVGMLAAEALDGLQMTRGHHPLGLGPVVLPAARGPAVGVGWRFRF